MSDSIEPTEPAPREPRRLSRRNLVQYGIGATVLPAFLAACGGGSSKSSNTPATGVPNAPKATMGAPTAGVLYPAGYIGPKATAKKPFGDGSQTFTVVVPQDTQYTGDWNKNTFTTLFAKKTGVNIKFETVVTVGADGSQDMTKVNAILAGGDLPDAFMGIPFSRDQLSLYGQQGVFVPLDDYIETYGVEMKEAIKNYPDLKTLSKGTDGKTYTYAGLNDCYHCRVSPGRAYINQKFLDKVGMKVPTTTEELRTVLKAFKTQNPNGHGDTIPWAGDVGDTIDRFFMGAFTYDPGDPWLRLENGKVTFVPNKDEWRAGLKYLRSLFDDGLLTADIFTRTSESLTKLGNNPGHARIGFIRAYYWGSFIDITYEAGARWRDYVPVPPLKGPDGTQIAAWDYYVPYGVGTGSVQITKHAKNPELLAQWADFQMELENTIDAYGGTENKNWEWAKAGQNGINGKQAVYSLAVWPAPVGTSWNQFSVMARSSDFRLGQFADPKNPNFEKNLYEASVPYEKFAQSKDWQLPPLIFDADGAASNADIATAMTQHISQSLANFALGKLDINDDAVWADYKSKIDKIGLAQYIQTYQQAYDNRPKG
jgi:putative aldouronate transport system substrate-binding protein